MVAASPALDRSRPIWRAVATSVVPEASQLGSSDLAAFEAIVARALAARPARTRRQVALFLTLLDWLPLLRYGRRLRTLDVARRTRFLSLLQREEARAARDVERPEAAAVAQQRQPVEQREEQRHLPPGARRAGGQSPCHDRLERRQIGRAELRRFGHDAGGDGAPDRPGAIQRA